MMRSAVSDVHRNLLPSMSSMEEMLPQQIQANGAMCVMQERELIVNKRELGVIIARFQAPALTDAHQYLLRQVATRVSRVLVLLGVHPVGGTKRNPLEYRLRERMLHDWWVSEYPADKELIVLPLPDCYGDEEWAANVDQLINVVNQHKPATIYCGPDGAGPAYAEAGGKRPVEVLDAAGGHASKVRANITPRYSEDFRAGVVYATENRFVNPYPVIDVMIKGQDGQILLAHKKIDRRADGREWRLVGGFVDPTDGSLEAAVRREVREETGVEISEPMYIGSAPVDDWRFRGGPEGILTSVFSAQWVFGTPKASDDIELVQWFSKEVVQDYIHPTHEHLLKLGLRVQ
jgi:bifunctional NMN adenylyltransferase/nudix hydrolase